MAVTRTVNDFILMVRKIESAHPSWSAERLNNELRSLAGYNDSKFQFVLNDSDPYNSLSREISDPNLNSDYRLMLREVKFLLGHEFINGVENGIVKDSRGLNVAMGHVITAPIQI